MLSFLNVALRRGPRALFTGATFSLFMGDKVGLVGPNGAGKSSLFALLTGELQADEGTVSVQPGFVIASVAQEMPADQRAAVDCVLDGDRELRRIEAELLSAEAAGDGARVGALHANLDAIGGYAARARAARLLAGLGFSAQAIERPVSEFSGGWQRRIALAQALMARSDVLLLDEPTNHLDLDAVLWLEEWLSNYPGLLVVIAHDREFLDRVINRVLSIESAQVVAYSGLYSDFESKRSERLAQQMSAHQRQQRDIQHMMDFVQRFKAKASKAKQAQSRLKALERMQLIIPAHADSPFSFDFYTPSKLPRPLLAIQHGAVGYDQTVIVDHVEISISPGDRIGLLGRNGAGKSTLTRVLAGVRPLLSGQRQCAQDLAIGYFAQHQLEQLEANASPLMHLKRHGGAAIAKAVEEEQRTFLGSFGFSGDRVFESIEPFSGGEKARLVLALLVSHRPNLLLLDEPTNHLDLEMRHALGMALQDFPGAIVLVSHDRHLLRSVTDELWLVADGRAKRFDGDLDDYAAWLKNTHPAGDMTSTTRPAVADKERKRQEAEKRQRLAPLRAELARQEKHLDTLNEALAVIDHQLTDEVLYTSEGKSALGELLQKSAALKKEMAITEAAWLEAAERLETANT
jgi:ATP-binding cassette subfamily F protein 3